jgi:glycosyltransferase involved in cell wall biosynthesis
MMKVGKMIVSGFTFCRNVSKLDYPFLESIRSILPIVDEMVINDGDSEDNTLDQIRSIRDPKIKVVESVWDQAMRKDGLIYAQQTNIALEHCRKDADWAFYLQADEVLHEKDYEGLLRSMAQYKDKKTILGLMSRYKHFLGDYQSIDPWAYRRAMRIVRPGGSVISVGDAVGFARASDNLYIGKKERHLWEYAEGHIYHYGWVKSPELLREKVKTQVEYYWEGTPNVGDKEVLASKEFIPERYFILKDFDGTHPAVMKERISQFPAFPPRKNRWLNPDFYRYVLRHGFKG